MTTKRTLLTISACLALSLGASGQTLNPWNCDNQKNTHLICLVPVATGSIGAQNSPAPAFNSAFATQLSQLPLLSSGSGIIFTFDKVLLNYVPSDSLGPILTERAQTIGRHKLLLGFAYQRFRFNSIDGTDLNKLPFVFQTSATPDPNKGGSVQYTAEQEQVSFKLDQYVGIATFGLDDKTDISVILPIERVSIGADAVVTKYTVGITAPPPPSYLPLGQVPPFQAPHVPGSASGIGDLLVNLKRLVWSKEQNNNNLAAGILVRFPTGDALNYLGSGAYGFNPYGIWSYQARLSPHVRLAYQFNTTTTLVPKSSGTGNSTLPGGLQYTFGADYVLFKKVPTTLAGDLLGYYIVNSPVLSLKPVSSPELGFQPLVGAYGLNTSILAPGMSSYNSSQLSVGLKVKPVKNLVLYGNVLIQLNNVGLRSNPAPLVGASYTF